jgi:hypothetical protein
VIDWLSPAEIYAYTRDEVIWILNNALEEWPDQDCAPVSHKKNQRMPKETEMLVRAELDVRISMLGDVGKRLYKLKDIEYDKLSYELQAAINYISGVCRRWQTCDKCLNKKCKRRGRKPCTFNQWLNHNR